MSNPHSAEHLLQNADHPSETDWQLAAQYAPLIKFDTHEPFLPSVVGYTIFRANAPSPSFPRQIEPGEAAFVIEYAIWWDWDIQHLYELEHVWVFVNAAGDVSHAEASWHGGYHSMALDGVVPLKGRHVRLFSEPGKHAFAPGKDWLINRAPKTRRHCTRQAGIGGVWITPLFETLINAKTPLADRLVHTYLARYAFVPGMTFSRIFQVSPEILVPWPALFQWIPGRVAWWVAELARAIPPNQRRFLRIAHRGASHYAPENTLAAIEKAAALKTDMVELDVRSSADGAPVIIHDDCLERATNGAGPVSERTLVELKALDAGNGESIPTLEEAIIACKTHEIGLYLELKSSSVIRNVVRLLKKHQFHQLTIVSSFRPDWLADIKALDPHLVTSVLFGSVNIDAVSLARSVNATYVHPAWENRAAEPHTLLTPAWLKRIRQAGLGLITWHEERPAEIAALRQLGVDGICSNAPDRLL